MSSQKAKEKFAQIYQRLPESVEFCPYRVCPIGAHVDHNLGKVTGLAIDKGIHLAYSPKQNGVIELCSLQFGKRAQWHVMMTPQRKQGDWADYLRGVTLMLANRYPLAKGLVGVIDGDLPIGGLSSSAAVTLAFMEAICDVNGIRLTGPEKVALSVAVENEYVGVSCGKLDQSCEIYSRKNQLLYLDTLDDSYELIPFGGGSCEDKVAQNAEAAAATGQTPAAATVARNAVASDLPFDIAIFFSGVERNLAGSKFNQRVDEARSAAYALKAYAGMEYGKFKDTSLREVPYEVFQQYRDRLPDNWRKRADHWYSEQERVREGVEAWRRGDIAAYGRLSFASGQSSITSWETGSPELKTLYELMTRTEGIYGGRFSGAGFKGCCVALIDPAKADEIVANVTLGYLKAFPDLEGKYRACICGSTDGLMV